MTSSSGVIQLPSGLGPVASSGMAVAPGSDLLTSAGLMGSEPGQVSAALWRRSEAQAVACLYHPFLLHLALGSLPLDAFADSARG